MYSETDSEKKIDPNLIEIINLLDKNKIIYWLCHGTLLGIVRDKNLIPWDHDIDIAVWDEKNLKEKIKLIMIRNNYKLKEKYLIDDDLLTFIKKGGREIDINFYHKKFSNLEDIAYVKWFIPKNSICKTIDAFSMAKDYRGKFMFVINKFEFIQPIFKLLKRILIKKNFFYKTAGYTQPLKFLKEFKKIDFKNMKVSVPSSSEDYLEYVYGASWKTPIKNYNWIKDSPSTTDINI